MKLILISDIMMYDLANYIYDDEKLTAVGIYLDIPNTKIKTHRTDNHSSITYVIYHL